MIKTINFRVDRYLFFMLLFSAEMWNASTSLYLLLLLIWWSNKIRSIAFLLSTFAMFTNTLALAYTLHSSFIENSRRTQYTIVLFTVGGIVDWPFSLEIAIPFVLEELFVRGADCIPSKKWTAWFLARVVRLFSASARAALLFVGVAVRLLEN